MTDQRLLDAAGGIVRGMSGSPIIQNGMIVGAVTHVFLNDPSRGYAVFAETMLEQMDALSTTAGRLHITSVSQNIQQINSNILINALIYPKNLL